MKIFIKIYVFVDFMHLKLKRVREDFSHRHMVFHHICLDLNCVHSIEKMNLQAAYPILGLIQLFKSSILINIKRQCHTYHCAPDGQGL